jgi:hypothetical protein
MQCDWQRGAALPSLKQQYQNQSAKQPNARINRARIQCIKHSSWRMKAVLFALRFNELLDAA